MMLRDVRLKMQSLILLALIPVLLLVTLVLSGLIYRHLHAVILEGFDRKLAAISSVMGCFIDGDEHARILKEKSEASPLYLKYVRSMQRIRSPAKKDLTYIYTQVLGKGRTIQYVLDGQQQSKGEYHSPIGEADEVPANEIRGVRDVLARGRIHLSHVRAWERWGQLKSGFAPIYNHAGKPVAVAGADLDTTQINRKTGVALAEVAGVAALCLLIAGVVSLSIALSLTRPIDAVKEVAIQVAAGRYGHRMDVARPLELAELAASFNTMSETLAGTVAELTQSNQALERRRRLQELSQALARTATATVTPDGSRGLDWPDDRPKEALSELKRRCEIALIARRLLERCPEGDWGLLERVLLLSEASGAGPGGREELTRQRDRLRVKQEAAPPR